jgi:hypothetical protein
MPPLDPYPAFHEACLRADPLESQQPGRNPSWLVPRLNRNPVIHRRHYQIDAAT